MWYFRSSKILSDQILHPLDPLDSAEIELASSIIRADQRLKNAQNVKFMSITLIEPRKEFCMFNDATRENVDREAYVVVVNNEECSTWEIELNLTKQTIKKWSRVPSGQPSVANEEFLQVENAIKSSPLVKAALKKRGIEDIDRLTIDPWPFGRFNLPYEGDGSRRRIMSMCFLKNDKDPNDFFYAHPIEGFSPIIDVNKMEVVHVEDLMNAEGPDAVPPVPDKTFHWRAKPENGLKPIILSQPNGPSFKVTGNRIDWASWTLRVGFNSREGLVLYNLTYKNRSILHRMAFSEMVVPYGDPAFGHFRKNAFDIGEYGLGRGANSLKNGCDCFGVIHYFDAYLCDINGKASKVENVICLHEEDAGLLFKHTDWHSGRTETMRNRKLVISSIATLANYEYAFYWHLFLDGKIESEVKLTGVVSVGACKTRDPKYGALLGPNLYAPIHEHYFCYRMDFALDGVNNSVVRVDVQAEEDDDKNPYKNAFYSKSTLLKTDLEAQGVVDTAKATYWKVINPGVLNELGNAVGYKLMPKGNVFPYAKEGSSVMKRAGFAKKHFWATPYDADEYFAGGKFPMQNDDGDNLEKWASKGNSVENRDIVVWYNLGVMHVVRPEDFPVMPCATAGFSLAPDGFFAQNPTMS